MVTIHTFFSIVLATWYSYLLSDPFDFCKTVVILVLTAIIATFMALVFDTMHEIRKHFDNSKVAYRIAAYAFVLICVGSILCVFYTVGNEWKIFSIPPSKKLFLLVFIMFFWILAYEVFSILNIGIFSLSTILRKEHGS